MQLPEGFWDCIWFSDGLENDSRRIRVWKGLAQTDGRSVLPFKGGSAILWIGMTPDRRTELVQAEGTMAGENI